MAIDAAGLARLVLLLPFLLLVPGASLLAALPPSPPPARAGGLVEATWRVVIVSTVISGALALVLAMLGMFRMGLLLLVVAAFSGLAWLAGRRRGPLGTRLASVFRPPTRSDLVPLFGFVVALAVFARPHETITGGADAGVYMSIAAHLARSGDLVVREPLLADLGPDVASAFTLTFPDGSDLPLRFPGFYAVDVAQGVSLPQFFPLHSVWLAIFYSLGGLWPALASLALWGALGVLGVYLAGRWALGPFPAALGAIGLMLVAPQVWFSRYTTSEALTQSLVWALLAAFAIYVRDGFPPRLGALAGLALGGVLLTRIDTPFLLALPAGLAAWFLVSRRHSRWAGRRRGLAAFFTPALVLGALAAFYAAQFAWPYVRNTAGVLPLLRPLLAAATLAVVAVGAAWLVARRRRLDMNAPTVMAALSRGRAVLALAIVGLGLWAYFVRPLFGAGATWSVWYGATVTYAPQLSLVQLGWYLSPVGVALAVAGAALAAWRAPWSRVWLLLAVGLFFSVLYLANPINNPRHIYVMRRYVPVVLPAFTLFAGYALAWLGGWLKEARPGGRPLAGAARFWRPVAAVALGAAMLVAILPVTWRVAAGREMGGAVAQLGALAARVEPNAVLVFRDADPVGNGAFFGTPLQFIFGRDAVSLYDVSDPTRYRRAFEAWQSQGRPVYLLLSEGATLPGAESLALTPKERVQLSLSALEATLDTPPSAWTAYRPSASLYRLGATGGGRVDVGNVDALAVVDGLYAAEGDGSLDFRWTNGDAVVRVATAPGATRLRLRLAGRPGQVTPLDIAIDGRAVGRLDVRSDLAEYLLPLPADLALGSTAEVRLVSPTFTPGGADQRQLGILVDWLGFE